MDVQSVALRDDLFLGAVSLERGAGSVKPWRIPYKELALFPPDGIGGKAEIPAGVRIAFCSDTTVVDVEVDPFTEPRLFDCVVDGRLEATGVIGGNETAVLFEGLAHRSKRIELFLSQKAPVSLRSLSVADDATVDPVSADQPRWTTYGSSISQCASASSPARTWPALVGRSHGLDLTCLGFGGNCHLDPMVARLIRDRPADFISLCLGINVYGAASLGPRTFRSSVIGFVGIVREGHPGVPIAVISPIISPPREQQQNRVGLSLETMRAEVREAVHALRACGDLDTHYVDGLELFGSECVSHLPDELHPDAEGYEILARNFSRLVAEPVFRRGARP